jgi:hypothetical protein
MEKLPEFRIICRDIFNRIATIKDNGATVLQTSEKLVIKKKSKKRRNQEI